MITLCCVYLRHKERWDERKVEYRKNNFREKNARRKKRSKHVQHRSESSMWTKCKWIILIETKLEVNCIDWVYLFHKETCLLSASTVHCCEVAIKQLWTSWYCLSLTWKGVSKDAAYTNLSPYKQGSVNFGVM